MAREPLIDTPDVEEFAGKFEVESREVFLKRQEIVAASKDLEEALKGNDKAEIEAKTEALGKASQKLGEKMYADMQAKAQAEGAASGAGPAGGMGAGPAGGGAQPQEKDMGNVVDAEFTEVKDKKG